MKYILYITWKNNNPKIKEKYMHSCAGVKLKDKMKKKDHEEKSKHSSKHNAKEKKHEKKHK
jgi:hypothetical protein